MRSAKKRGARAYRRLRFVLIAAYVVFAGGTGATAAWYLYSEYRQTLQLAQARSSTLTRALEEHVLRTFTTIDIQLRNAGRRLVETRALERPSSPAVVEMLRQEVAQFDLLRSIYVYDASGRGHATSLGADISRLRASQFEYLHEILESGTDQVVVGRVINGAVTRRPNIPVARAVRSGDGRLAGIIGTAIEPSYFVGFYKSLNLATNESLALLRSDGAVLVRVPEEKGRPADVSGTQLFREFIARNTAGTVDGVSGLDGIRRLIAYRHVPGLKLIVFHTQTYAAVIAPWRHLAWEVGSLEIGSLAVFLGLLWLALRELARREDAERELRHSERRYRELLELAADAIFVLDREQHYVDVNQAACEMLGYSREELIQLTIQDLLPPEDLLRKPLRLEELQAGMAVVEERRLRRKDGTFATVETKSKMLPDGRLQAMARDLSERKKTQTGLARLAAIVDFSYDAILSRGLDRKIVTWNAAAERLFGYTASEVIGREVSFLIPPDREAEAAQMRGLLADDQPIPPYDTVRLTKDGRRIDVSVTQSPIKDANGQMFGASVTFRDISERRLAVQALRESQSLFQEFAENTPVIFWIRETESRRFLYVSPAFERITGWTMPESWVDFRRMIHPQDIERVSSDADAMPFGGLDHQYRIARPDGAMRWLRVQTFPVRNSEGEVYRVAGIGEDITERKQAEAHQRLAENVFDNALDGIVITDTDSNIVTVNPAFTVITGYPAAEVIGKNPKLLNSGLHEKAFYDAMWAAFATQGRWQGEIWDRRKTGELICVHQSISAVRNERGELAFYCMIFADITEQKLAEGRLVRLNAELEERVAARTQELERLNSELDAFSYSVSHDLRAPLRAMTGFSAIVMDANRDKLEPESVDHLRRIQAGAQRMTQLIEDLLDLARISRQHMHRVEFDFSALAVEAAKSLSQADPEHRVQLTVQPDMHAQGDPRLVRVMLDNLLGNAWKFTARTAEARIEVGRDERDGETVYFVRDNGAGFDMQYADKLFGAFQRLHRQDEYEGTGIGLSIVQRIVTRHGGRVWAEAKVGHGATFCFTIGAG